MTSQCPMVRPPLNHTSESELSASQGSTPNPVSFGHEPRPEAWSIPASVEQVTQTPHARYQPWAQRPKRKCFSLLILLYAEGGKHVKG